MSDLAVVLVHYYTPQLLPRAIAAIRDDASASGVSVDIVVVDNGSDAADGQMLRALPARYVRSMRNLGFAGAVNLGVAGTAAPRVVIMNPDVEVRRGCLALLMAELGRGAAAAGPQFSWDDGGSLLLPPPELRSRFDALLPAAAAMHPIAATRVRQRWRRHARRHWLASGPIASTSLSGALLAIRRDAWDRIGPFDAGYQLYFEETDWLKRCQAAGAPTTFVPAARAQHRYNQSARREPRAAEWFAASAARFAERHYGARFHALMRRLPAAWPAIAGAVALTMPPSVPLSDLPPCWIEISPGTAGIPAAAVRLADRGPQAWTLPADVWQHLAGGDYLAQVVDEAGHERARYRFRAADALPADVSSRKDAVC